ncbi:MAG: hypothetical protein ACPG19_02165 [Saprospiraceae bacterium]
MKAIIKNYYREMFKRAFITNMIFMLIIVAVNFLVDKNMLPSSFLDAVKLFAIYISMVLVIVAYNYYINIIHQLTFNGENKSDFIIKHLEYLLYENPSKKQGWTKMEAKENNNFMIFGNIFFKNENNKTIILGPKKILKKLQKRLEKQSIENMELHIVKK